MNRLYVLIRRDLAPRHQAVQAGHAVAQWCANEASRYHWDGREIRSVPWRWNNEILVYLAVKDEQELREWHARFAKPESAFGLTEGSVLWEEPDWGNQATAMAVVGKREEFEGLELLKF